MKFIICVNEKKISVDEVDHIPNTEVSHPEKVKASPGGDNTPV